MGCLAVRPVGTALYQRSPTSGGGGCPGEGPEDAPARCWAPGATVEG